MYMWFLKDGCSSPSPLELFHMSRTSDLTNVNKITKDISNQKESILYTNSDRYICIYK